MKANLFILGAPKCGTTALSGYLAQHPNICMSVPKETNFFCTDFTKIKNHPLLGFKDIDEYHNRCFPHFEKHHKVICDSTVWNLYSKKAIKNIIDYNSDANFIVMLRNPVDMVFSLHNMYVGLGFEKNRDFLNAFNRSDKELNNLDSNKLDNQLLEYKKVALFSEQLNHLYNYVPKRNVKVLIHEDFLSDTQGIYQDVLDFLELPKVESIDFTRVNVQRKIKSPLLANLLRSEFTRVSALWII